MNFAYMMQTAFWKNVAAWSPVNFTETDHASLWSKRRLHIGLPRFGFIRRLQKQHGPVAHQLPWPHRCVRGRSEGIPSRVQGDAGWPGIRAHPEDLQQGDH